MALLPSHGTLICLPTEGFLNFRQRSTHLKNRDSGGLCKFPKVMHNIVAILEVSEPDSGAHSQLLHHKASIIQNTYWSLARTVSKETFNFQVHYVVG